MGVDLNGRKQREVAWQEGESLFQAIAETTSDAIIVIDSESAMLFVNAAAEKIFGYAVAEMAGAPLTMLMPDYLRHVHAAALKRYVETGRKHTSWAGVELPGLHRSGREIPLEISFNEFIKDGRRFFTGIVRDITERKRAEKKYHSIIENAVEGIFQTTPDGRFISVNPAMARIFGYESTEELITERVDIARQHYVEPERRSEFKRMVAERGIVQGFEYQARRKDGSKIWISENVRAVRDADGALLYYEGFLEDITERKRTAEALSESEDRYRDLVEHSHDLMCTHDLEGRIISVNPWAAKTLGYDPDDLLKKNIQDLLVSEAQEGFVEYLAAIRRDGFARGLMHVQTAAGERRIWEYHNTLRAHGVAAPIVRGMAHDITERTRAEEALRQSEKDYRGLFENAHDAIIILSPDGETVLEVNQRACQIYGFTRTEFIGMSLETISQDVERGRLQVKETLEHGSFYNFETVQYRKDGTQMFLDVNASVVEYKGQLAIQSINRDITERKRAEERLRESEERFCMFSESSSEGIIIHVQGKVIEANRTAALMCGYDPSELIGMPLFAFADPVSHETIRQHISAGEETTYEAVARRKDGSTFAAELTGKNFIYKEQQGRLVLLRNITERKRAEQSLRESEARHHAILEAQPDLLFLLSTDGVYLDYHAKDKRDLLLPPEQFLGRNVRDVLPPELAGKIADCLKQVTESNEPCVIEFSLPLHGGINYYEARLARCGTEAVVCVSRNITERKLAEKERTQLLRRLVAAQDEERHRIARELHDYVGQYLAALKLELKSLKDSSQAAPDTHNAVSMLQEMTAEFSRGVRHLALELRPPALEDLGLHAALSNYLERWSERYGITADLHSNGLLHRRFPAYVETALYRVIQEALNNVLKHAQARHVSLVLEYRGGRLRAIIEDDGCGFNVDAALNTPVAERRLGLTGMRERVESAGGTLGIESSPGVGTTLAVRIPVPSE
jgi:PAS domain S-box-containing protein